jgi:hypothetical protein
MECHGTPSDPCSATEQLDKFRILAGVRLPPDAVSDLARLVNIVASRSVRELTHPLGAGDAVLHHKRSQA